MKIFLWRLFRLSVMSIGFPFLLISLIFAVSVIPIAIILDSFYFLFTGDFRIADIYINNYFDKVAFGWYFLIEEFLNNLIYK